MSDLEDDDDYMDEDDMDVMDSEDELDDDDDGIDPGDDIDDEQGMNDEDDDDDEVVVVQEQAPPPPAEEDAAINRRRAIQQIMRDNSLSDQEKRMRIQNLMSGGRTEVAPPPAPVLPQPGGNNACVHYERNCNIVAPCCNRVFGCRICHDELSPPGHEPLNRFMIREVVCKLCGTRQATSNQCINCKASFAEYHCRQCNLWMSKVCF